MRALAICCFFLSGASGLIFQVIWSRQFSLVFGSTSLATSTVLTAFMAGLALGSYLAGRLADRLGDPLRAYALAEAGVGLLALGLPGVVAKFGIINAWGYQALGDNWALLTLLRFAASAAVIVLPTTLMGATLPLLSRHFVRNAGEHARVGVRVGTLYAVNTFGAVLGTFIGGFVLLPTFGLSATNRIAAATNIALGLVVMIALARRKSAAKRRSRVDVADPEIAELLAASQHQAVPTIRITALTRRMVITAFFISGAAAMVYQVVWTRALAMNIGSSVYSFTIVLTTFLLGLAGGAAAFGRLSQRSADPVAWLAGIHLAIAVLVGLSQLCIEQLPYLYLFLIDGSRMDADAIMWRQFLMAAAVMLPATFAMGGVFPLTMRIVSQSVERVGRDVGTVYSINTLGAIVGSFLAGFVVIPLLQLQAGIFLGISLSLLLAAGLLPKTLWSRPQKLLGLGTCCALLLTAWAVAHWAKWDLYQVSVGLFRPTVAREALAQRGAWKKPKLVFYRDGVSTTVSVEQWAPDHYSMKNNGKVDASTGDDMPTQIAVGLLPLLMHPQVPALKPDVALIGFASGVTAGSVLQYPVNRLDVVELEPAILQASRFFEAVNNRPLRDPRLRVITDDGRNYLMATARHYDVIINEPSNPWITGVSNLFTEDYFRIAKARLKPGGLFCSWAQMYELGPRRVKSIYRAFLRVFRYVYVFSATTLSSDTFLLGSDKPLRVDIQRLRRAFRIPTVSKEMRRAKIASPDDLLALLLMGPRGAAAFVAGAAVNTDDNALVEFAAPRDLFNHNRYDYYISRVYGHGWSYGRLDDIVTGYKGSEQWARLVRALLAQGRLREAEHLATRVRPTAGPFSKRTLLLFDLISPPDQNNGTFPLTEDGAPLRGPAPPTPLTPGLKQVLRDFPEVQRKHRQGRCESALKLIEAWPEATREALPKDVHLLWGHLAMRCDQARVARNILEPIVSDAAYLQAHPALYFHMGQVYFRNADFGKALRFFEDWIAHRERVGKPVLPPPR